MVLIFNKQYRQESNLISDLSKKIKKSQSLRKEYKGNNEIYTLDNIIIDFAITDNTITVKDKKKNVIVALDCKWAQEELQEARFYMFSNLLNVARSVYDRRTEKSKTFAQAQQDIQARQAVSDELAAAKSAHETAIRNAREKLKSL